MSGIDRAGRAGAAALLAAVMIARSAGGEEPSGERAEYVGSRKCRICHLREYRSWEPSRHAKALELLRPGARVEAKEFVGLDPAYDYRGDAYCLPCHTVGFGQPGGFSAAAAAAELAGVGCEACHGGGSRYIRPEVMGLENRDHSFQEVIAAGLVYPVPEAICARCHNLAGPFNPDTDPKYSLDYTRDTLERSTHEHPALKYEHGALPAGVLFQD